MKKAPKMHLVLINVILITAFLLSSCAEISPGDSIVFFLLRAFKDRIYEELGDLTRKYQAINMDDPMDPEDYTDDEPPIVIIVTATPAAAAEATSIPGGDEPPVIIEIPMADPQQTQLPSEHITYKGNVAGLTVTIDIYYPIEGTNSVLGTVSGPVCEFDGDIYGTFNAQALNFTAEFGCFKNSDLSGDSLWEGTITGVPSADFNSITGTLVDGDGQPHEFTFYSQD